MYEIVNSRNVVQRSLENFSEAKNMADQMCLDSGRKEHFEVREIRWVWSTKTLADLNYKERLAARNQ